MSSHLPGHALGSRIAAEGMPVWRDYVSACGPCRKMKWVRRIDEGRSRANKRARTSCNWVVRPSTIDTETLKKLMVAAKRAIRQMFSATG